MMDKLSRVVGLARAVASTPHLRAQGLIYRDLTSWLRVEYLGTASDLGLLRLLARPQTLEQIAQALDVEDVELLSSYLTLGQGLGEFTVSDGRWSLRGARSRALADPEADAIAAFLEESALYQGDVYRGLRERLAGGLPGDYLRDFGPTVARSSRSMEPLLAPFVREVAQRHRPARLIDVGCGSGIYLRRAAEAVPSLTATGIDLDSTVVEEAQRNITGWGLGSRVSVRRGDLLDPPADLRGPWDMALLLQNVYYFPAADRAVALGRLRELLAPGGVALVATVVADPTSAMAAHMDVVLQSTAGTFALPTANGLRQDLLEAGFTDVCQRRLVPGQPVYGFVAS